MTRPPGRASRPATFCSASTVNLSATRTTLTIASRSSAGDLLPFVIEHAGRRIDVSLKLDEDPYIRCPGTTAWYRNLRADDFPAVFEHDIPLLLDECGGPVIDLDGRAVGMTIARVAQHGCMAIPSDVIPGLVSRLKK